MIRRCPFLNTAPSVYQKLSTEPALVSYAHKCPVLMELASRALPCSAAVARGSPANEGQLQTCVLQSQRSFCTQDFIFACFIRPEAQNHRVPEWGNATCWLDSRLQMPFSDCKEEQGDQGGQCGAARRHPGDGLSMQRWAASHTFAEDDYQTAKSIKGALFVFFLLVSDVIEADKPKSGVSHLLKDHLCDGEKVKFISINHFTALLMYF